LIARAAPIANNAREEPSMNEVVILHNPRCSKSRATLALLESRGIDPRIVDYIATPPSLADIERILDGLGVEPRALIRRDEPEYAALGLDDPALPRARLVAAMHAHPRLIQRPIVCANGKVALGRPPEDVLAIL
jgi:arsenate reductase